jgi:hypothetical protein
MSGAAQTLTVVIPLRVKPRGGRKAMVTPGVLPMPTRADITLVKAAARAFRWRRMLEAGRFATINELAAAEKINSSFVSRVLRLTLLAPDLVEAILDGRQPEGMTLPGLWEPIPAEWEAQRIASCCEYRMAPRSCGDSEWVSDIASRGRADPAPGKGPPARMLRSNVSVAER